MLRWLNRPFFSGSLTRRFRPQIVYEDDRCLAFEDINPQAPTHLLLIPKKPIPSMAEVTDEGRRVDGVPGFARFQSWPEKLGLNEAGYRVVNNCGAAAGQEVLHFHFHILSGRKFTWPPG